MKKGITAQHLDLVISALELFEIMSNIWFDAELNGLQNDIKFFLEVVNWSIHFVKLLKNDKYFEVHSCTVFGLFRFYFNGEEKCRIYSFVEQVKPYRLVYDSIWTVKNLGRKNSQKVIGKFFAIFKGVFGGCNISVRPISPIVDLQTVIFWIIIW
jgi:hypothetical protein